MAHDHDNHSCANTRAILRAVRATAGVAGPTGLADRLIREADESHPCDCD